MVTTQQESQQSKASYEVSYWIHPTDRIALIRINDTTVQGWQAKGDDPKHDFEYRAFRTTYPSKQRLDEALAGYHPSNVDEYLKLQFDHHHFDDQFRRKANEYKDKLYQQKLKSAN